MMTVIKRTKNFFSGHPIRVLLLIVFILVFAVEMSLPVLVGKALNDELQRKLPAGKRVAVSLGDLDIGLLRPFVAGRDVEVMQDGKVAARVTGFRIGFGSWGDLLGAGNREKAVFSSAQLKIDGLNIGPELLDQDGKTILKCLGLFRVEGALFLDVGLDLKKGEVRLNSLKLNFRDLFELDLRLQLAGLQMESADPLSERSALRNLHLVYFDKSIMARLMTVDTFPEFLEIKEKWQKNYASKAKAHQVAASNAGASVSPDYSKMVRVEGDTKKKIEKFYIDYVMKPSSLILLQEPGAELKIRSFLSDHLSQPVDALALLKKLGLQLHVDTTRYF